MDNQSENRIYGVKDKLITDDYDQIELEDITPELINKDGFLIDKFKSLDKCPNCFAFNCVNEEDIYVCRNNKKEWHYTYFCRKCFINNNIIIPKIVKDRVYINFDRFRVQLSCCENQFIRLDDIKAKNYRNCFLDFFRIDLLYKCTVCPECGNVASYKGCNLSREISDDNFLKKIV